MSDVHKELVIAIDETGKFQGRKLLGTKKGSGVVAVATVWPRHKITSLLKTCAGEHNLVYPHQFHAMEIVDPDRARGARIDLHGKNGRDVYEAINGSMDKSIRFRCGVYGKLRARAFFHEQQAYGEMLLALLNQIPRDHGATLNNSEKITIIIASRERVELMGFYDRPDSNYHQELCEFIQGKLTTMGWPRQTEVMWDSATKNPYLILADFSAMALSDKPAWCHAAAEIPQPAVYEELLSQLVKIDPASALLLKIYNDDATSEKHFNRLPEQTAHETLRKLTSTAHAEVTDRHGKGSLDRAWQLVEFLWPIASKGAESAILGELCTIAAEVCSHKGLSESSEEVLTWSDRANKLGSGAWANTTAESYTARLNYRCQTVQQDDFNVFAFEDAYLEFSEHKEDYENTFASLGIDENDELYGKIIGTIGQSCGFLRSQYPDNVNEAWGHLNESKKYFQTSDPLFRSMNLGYRLTDLWDRDDLDAMTRLMSDEKLPGASDADPYALLHRLRHAALTVHQGAKPDNPERLITRLLSLTGKPESMGRTPYDLALKWAIFLEPENSRLKTTAIKWLEQLNDTHVALLATSLPLQLQVGRVDEARGQLDALLAWPAFEKHWATTRARALADAFEQDSALDYDTLRGMPWNYA